MKSIPTAFFILAIVAAFGLSACSGDSTETRAETASADATSESTDVGSSEPAEAQVADADAVDPAESGPAAEAYHLVIEEVRRLEKTATTQEKMYEAVAAIEKVYKGFIAEYPDSDEAIDAKFQLGILYVSVGRPKLSADYLDEYIRNAPDPEDVRVGYAHFYLAQAYESSDQFDKAKTHYQAVMERKAGLDQRLVQQATASLVDLDTKRRLSIGGDPIPFETTDIKGKKLSLDKFKGKVVLLDFWATWCGPCRVEMPNVVATYKKYKDKGFEIIGVSLDRDRAALDRYIAANDMGWPQHFDGRYWNNEIAQMYKVRSIPTTYLIDREGKIRYRSLRGKALEEAVKELVNETS